MSTVTSPACKHGTLIVEDRLLIKKTLQLEKGWTVDRMTVAFPLNLVKDHLVAWLLQPGMDYLVILDSHPLSTPSNIV